MAGNRVLCSACIFRVKRTYEWSRPPSCHPRARADNSTSASSIQYDVGPCGTQWEEACKTRLSTFCPCGACHGTIATFFQSCPGETICPAHAFPTLILECTRRDHASADCSRLTYRGAIPPPLVRGGILAGPSGDMS